MAFKREALKELRERLGMSRDDLAFALSDASRLLDLKNGYTGATIGNYESGRTTPQINTLDYLDVLAKYFGHSDLVFYETPNLPKRERG